MSSNITDHTGQFYVEKALTLFLTKLRVEQLHENMDESHLFSECHKLVNVFLSQAEESSKPPLSASISNFLPRLIAELVLPASYWSAASARHNFDGNVCH